ncbi:MAG TPA: hypothetical protein VLJ37_00815 [bacterium]|nr:hypothetical protein [bacterium]
MKRIFFAGLVVSLSAFAGCGGTKDQGPTDATSFCEPSPVRAGQAVSCSIDGDQAADLTECTFFVGKQDGRRIPVEASLSGSILSFQMPVTPAGMIDVVVGCGEDFKTLGGIQVADAIEADGNTEAAERPEDDTVIEPRAPASPTVPEGETAPVATPPPAATPAPATFEVSLEGSLVANPVQFGAARLSGRIQGGGALREAYVYGPFAPDGNCERLLAIDPSGGPLNPGSRNYDSYRDFVGHACDEAAGNCEGFTAAAEDGTPAPVNCRIDLPRDRDAFDFYFRLSQRVSSSFLVTVGEDGTLRTDGVDIAAPVASLTNVRIDVSETSPEISVSFSYANAAAAPVVMGCRPVGTPSRAISASGSVAQRCALENEMTVTALAPGIGGGNVARETYKVQCGEPQAVLKKMAFRGANGEVCTVGEDDWSRSCDARGEFELRGEAYRTCEIQRQRPDGGFEFVSSHSVPWVHEVKLTETDAACSSTNNVGVPVTAGMVDHGRAILTRRLKRSYECTNYAFTVRGENGRETALSEHAPYGASFELLPGTADQYCRGRAPVGDSGISGIPSLVVIGEGNIGHSYYSTFNRCPANDGGVFDRKFRIVMKIDGNASAAFKISWRGKHVKNVRYSCTTDGPGVNPAVVGRVQRYDHDGRSFPLPTSVRNVTITQPDPSSYAVQTAVDGFKIHDDLIWATVQCTLTAVTYDNREIVAPVQHWDACTAEFPTCLAQ